MSSMVYSFIHLHTTRDEKTGQQPESTESKPITSTANSTETNNNPNSEVCSTDKSQTTSNK